MMSNRDLLPPPGWNPTTEGHWLEAGRGKLAVQICNQCRAHRWPPTEVCYRCQSMDWSWAELPGTGKVFTYTWTDTPVTPKLAHLGVYNASIIELDGVEGEAVRMLGRVTDVDKQTLRCDLPVEVHFDHIDNEVAVPVWRPRRT
jgi:uncharacterized OB-fold protein